MNYLHFDLGVVDAGTTAHVTLSGVESDVFLVDATNYSRFRSGRDFSYTGGHYNSSPVNLAVPNYGTWTVVVIPGAGGGVTASVEVLAA